MEGGKRSKVDEENSLVQPTDDLELVPVLNDDALADLPLPPAPLIPAVIAQPDIGPRPVAVPSANPARLMPSGAAPVPTGATGTEELAVGDESPLPGRLAWASWTALPSWAISMVVHVAVLFILAAFSLEPVQQALSVLQATSVGSGEDSLDSFDLQGPPEAMEAPSGSDDPIEPTAPSFTSEVAIPEISTASLAVTSTLGQVSLDAATESVMPSSLLSATARGLSSGLNGRSMGMKSQMVERFGGNAQSEKAVANALKWIANHQAPNGGWSFAHSRFCRGKCENDGDLEQAVNGATAMAILPFLGAGQTHMQGQYKDTVKRGLAFLINNMKVTNAELPRGSWHESGGNMYSHGLAAITICEAYAMTRDPDLLQPAQLALNFIVYAQDPRGGGWRYQPQEPGDTSVLGWCLMALKSGSMGNLTVPQISFRGASQFLDSVSTNNGAYYGYDGPSGATNERASTIAVGLLCRMYMGWPKEHPGLKEGIEFLSKIGPQPNDMYFSYYATQVMRHFGGEKWTQWNSKMRDSLIETQVKEGHAAGSWFSEGGHGSSGGRLYSTSMATMILEVYYRHMPIYSEKSSSEDFEL